MGVRRREGAIVEVPLHNGSRAFGRLLAEPLIEFFDLRVATNTVVTTDEILSANVAFRVWVMNHAIQSGRWPVLDTVPLTSRERRVREPFFKQDALTGELTIYWADPDTGESFEIPASRAEIDGLECAAVWDPEHVEDRLRDHFAGRPTKWRESLEPQ